PAGHGAATTTRAPGRTGPGRSRTTPTAPSVAGRSRLRSPYPGGSAQPDRHAAGRNRGGHGVAQARGDLVQVDLGAQPRGEGVDRPGGVIAGPVEPLVDRLLEP